jgi:mRNA-degrading endonuclease RelE of RelBE toxin-antitoxin system
MAFSIEMTRSAIGELRALRAFDQRRIRDAIRQQLENQPVVPTRNRKSLGEPSADFDYVPPLWEVRVEDYRVFYDVNEAEQTVFVRAIRRKSADQTSEDVLHERGNG